MTSSSEWSKSAILELIKGYKKNEFLYNQKHQSYHKKSMRMSALDEICKKLDEFRPGTTVNDVLKKIQTLRTQYGQELAKIDRTRHDESPYIPSIYWFQPISFLKPYIKKRNLDNSVKREEPVKAQQEEYFEIEEIIDSPDRNSHPIVKKARILKSLKSDDSSLNESSFPDQELETIEYTVIDNNSSGDPTASDSSKPTSSTQFVEITAQPSNNDKQYRAKKRAKGLGKFVSSLMCEIVDDKLFLETQQKVLSVIYEAQLKQLPH